MFSNVHSTSIIPIEPTAALNDSSNADPVERFIARGGIIKKLKIGEHTLDGFEAVDGEGFLYDGD